MSEFSSGRISTLLRDYARNGGPFFTAVERTLIPVIVTDPRQPDNPIVYANTAFVNLTGYGPHELLGRNCRFLQGRGTDRDAIDRIREAIKGGREILGDILNYRKDGSPFWNRLIISPVRDEAGDITHFFASQLDLSPSKAAETAERRLGFAIETARLGSWSLDLRTGQMAASATLKANFGRPADEPFSYEALLATIHPDDLDRVRAAIDETLRIGADFDLEHRFLTPDGEVRWIQAKGQLSLGVDGRPQAMIGFTLDITDRKRDEELRVLLADELQHRVKNTLAVVQGIANLTFRDSDPAEIKTFFGRLRALSDAQDILTQSHWREASIRDIIDSALRPHHGPPGRFDVIGPELRLNSKQALALTLALHELATNALKYGALSVDTGRVSVEWRLEPEHRFRFQWREQGGPVVAGPKRRGGGTLLLQRNLAAQFSGHVKVEYRPSGLVLDLDATLESLTPVGV